ncbi:hypothetical protein AeMF1_003623 [Aphanomyces euteiches]|nr:hypothetical protein AeMF1_003623 [Aphanomyces euteiches]
MLWKWLVMPQGLSNAPATFSPMVTAKLRPLRAFAPSYFDDIYIHSRLLTVLRDNGLYANLAKCMFGVEEIPVLGDFVGINGCRADPSKVKAIRDWPVPSTQTELRSWLGLATYLHKFSANFASLAQPLSALLAKDAPWDWTQDCHDAFNAVKDSLVSAPVLALPDFSRPFSVVCDAPVKAIGCCLMQVGEDGRDRPVSYQSRQLQKAEKAYPVHDLELLAMKYALTKFRIYLLGSKPFVVYTDHASLRTAVKSSHISQRMARWLAFFAEFNFTVEYKPGRQNVLADALSRRPSTSDDTSLNHVTHVLSNLYDRVRASYASDKWLSEILSLLCDPTASPKRSSLKNFSVHNGLVYYTMASSPRRLAIPADEALRHDILHDCHAAQTAGHFGRDKTYLTRIVTSANASRLPQPLEPLWHLCQYLTRSSPRSVWIFIFGLPRNKHGRTGIWTCEDRLSKYLIAVACRDTITAEESAQLYFDHVFCRFGLPAPIVSDRDPRFTSKFWSALFALCGTTLDMSMSDHPETDGQPERANRVIEDVLRSYTQSKPRTWSAMLSHVVFAYNNSVQASTGHTPFYVLHLRHPRLPLDMDAARLSGGGSIPARTIASVKHFIESRKSLLLHVRENLASAQEKQALQANKTILLHASAVPKTALGNPKLQPPWLGPFPIKKKISNTAYKLELPTEWQIHPTFCVGKIKRYLPATPDPGDLSPARSSSRSTSDEYDFAYQQQTASSTASHQNTHPAHEQTDNRLAPLEADEFHPSSHELGVPTPQDANPFALVRPQEALQPLPEESADMTVDPPIDHDLAIVPHDLVQHGYTNTPQQHLEPHRSTKRNLDAPVEIAENDPSQLANDPASALRLVGRRYSPNGLEYHLRPPQHEATADMEPIWISPREARQTLPQELTAYESLRRRSRRKTSQDAESLIHVEHLQSCANDAQRNSQDDLSTVQQFPAAIEVRHCL